jgi:hypothetical protein
MQVVNNMGNCVQETGRKGKNENCRSAKLFCKPKTALKNKAYL